MHMVFLNSQAHTKLRLDIITFLCTLLNHIMIHFSSFLPAHCPSQSKRVSMPLTHTQRTHTHTHAQADTPTRTPHLHSKLRGSHWKNPLRLYICRVTNGQILNSCEGCRQNQQKVELTLSTQWQRREFVCFFICFMWTVQHMHSF